MGVDQAGVGVDQAGRGLRNEGSLNAQGKRTQVSLGVLLLGSGCDQECESRVGDSPFSSQIAFHRFEGA